MDQKQNNFFCEDEDILFYFQGLISKFTIFIEMQNLFNPKK